MQARQETKQVLDRGAPRCPGERAGAEARAAALARLGFLLSAAREPVAAAQHVVDAAFEFFQWDASFLVLYKAETDRVDDLINIDTVHGVRQCVPAVLQDEPPSPMMRKVIEQGAQLILRRETVNAASETVPFGDKARLSRSLMFVPLRLEDRSIGVLSVQSYEGEAYDQNDLVILQGLADHAAGALGRLQAESELRASEERLRLAIDSAGMGTWEYAQATDEFSYSEACARILGLSAGTSVSFESFLSELGCLEGQDAARRLRDALQTDSGERLMLECRIRRPNGSERWVIVGAKRFLTPRRGLPSTAALMGTVLDITDRKEVERALRAAQGELSAHAQELEKTVQHRTVRLQETINELEHVSYALKHDMRAPLRAMGGYAQLAEEELAGKQCPQAMEYLRLIGMASERLDHLIQDSLTYNQAVLGKMQMGPVNIGRLLEGLVETYPQFHAANADIKLEGNLRVVLGNESALTQCFSNLLDNAVKFVARGQKPSIRVWSQPHGERARIWVEDRGIGIPANFQERIFLMWHRGTHDYEGTGIGLAIVRKLVQRMGGTVGVESEKGQGSRFWIELMLATAPTPSPSSSVR